MTPAAPTWLGLVCLVLLVAFMVFAFRQGMKVKRPPQGVPPEAPWPGP